MNLTWKPPELAVNRRTASLIPREADVLTGLCLGLTNSQIGRRLHLSEKTVKNYCTGLYQALDARDRCHAIAIATSGRVDIRVEVGP